MLNVIVKRWFQKTYGNTYHSVTISKDGIFLARNEYEYGYSTAYRLTTAKLLKDAGIITGDDDQSLINGLYELEAANKIEYHVSDVKRKKDL